MAKPVTMCCKPLLEWRLKTKRREHKETWEVLNDLTLIEIAETLPTTPDALLRVENFGATKLMYYGADILSITKTLKSIQQ